MNSQRKSIFFKSILTVLPAMLLGTVGMICNDVPKVIWLQNIIAMVLCGTIAFFLVTNRVRKNDMVIAGVSLVLLFLTLFASGMEGVHRWIRLVIINVNVAMVVLPILLVAIYGLLEKEKVVYALAIIINGAVILFLQPDASQLAGFAIPVIVFLFYKKINGLAKYAVSALLIGLTIYSWVFLDKLEPVSYVEGILGLLNNISPIWLVLGIISLVLIPLPYFLFPSNKFRVLSVGIGLYYCIIIVSTVFGNFPVPIMGYGVSPIIGYWLVFFFLDKE